MKKIIPVILLIIISCKSKQEVVEVNDNTNNTEFVDISVEKNKNIQFTIKNISSEVISIFGLGKLNIEKYEDNSWKKLRILPCPCDAPCHAGNEMEQLLTGEIFIVVWNMEESWCGEKNELGIKKTVKQKVEEGIYRIRILYGTNNKSKNILYKEFEIK